MRRFSTIAEPEEIRSSIKNNNTGANIEIMIPGSNTWPLCEAIINQVSLYKETSTMRPWNFYVKRRQVAGASVVIRS